MTPRFPRRPALRLADPNQWLLRRRRARARRRGDDGFVLLESIVSISLIMIMTAALAALFISTSQATNHLRIRQVAVQLADSGIERVRAYEPAMLQNDRDPDLVEDQYRDGLAGPSGGDKLSNMLGTIADPYPASGTGKTAARPAVPASCPAASEPTDIPTAPVCQGIGNRPFLVNYYLGNCYVPTSGTACIATKPTSDTFLTYLRAVIAVTWANDHCSNSSCMYVTSTLINDNPDPRFNVNYPVVQSPDIVAPDRISNVGDTVPFNPAVALRTGTGVAPFTWAATSLPPGLKMATDGTITGTIKPQTVGTMAYTVTVTVVDGLIQRKAATFTWTVRQPTITSPGNQNTVINTPVTLPVVATCWVSPCTYTMSGGPTWLSINPATGTLTGTPTAVGTTSGITISVTDGNGIKATSDPFDWVVVPTPAAVCVSEIALTNGSFEAPALNTSVPVNTFNYVTTGAPNWMRGGDFPLQWNTTEADGIVELWHNGFNVQSANGGQPISAEDGSTWAELNANATGALYQDLATDPGVVLQWSVWHRGRYSSAANASKKDVMQVQIGSTTSQSPQIPTGQATPAISDGPDAWVLYRGFYVVPPGQTTTRFQFAAISTASGDNSIGNFIDNLSLNNKVACVQQLPDPQTSTVGTPIAGLQLSAIRGSGNYAWGGGSTLPPGLSISASGLITGTPTTTGTYSVAVTLTDTQTTYSTTVPFTWTVVPRPTITAPSTQTTSSGGAVSLALSTSCLNRPCTYTMNTGPAGLTVSSSGVISGTITSAAQNFNNVTVTVQDKAGIQATTNPFIWQVISGPGIVSPGDQKTLRGAAVSLAITASGGIGTLSYSASGLPSWLTIDGTTGLITGVAPSSVESTTLGIKITVTDSQNASATTAPFKWTVYSAPTVTAPANQADKVGSAVSLQVTYVCQNGPCTFTMSGQPTGLSISNTGLITGTVGGLPQTYANVRVTITDLAGASTRSSAFTWTISPGLVQVTQADQVSTLNTAITPLQMTASGGSGSYVWTGSPPAGLAMTSAGLITGSPTALRTGPLTLTATDTVTGNFRAVTFNWAVVAKPTVTAPATQTTTVGKTVSLTLASTCPAIPCTYSMTGAPTGLSINNSAVISGTVGGAAQTYANVIVTITDTNGASVASSAFSWIVKAAPTVTAPATQTTTVGKAVSLTLASTCANTPCTYSMTGAPTGLSINNSAVISGTVGGAAQTYANVIVTITDASGVSVASSPFSWIVKAAPAIAPVNQTTTLGAVVNYTPPSTCPNTPCTFTMTGAPTGLTINNTTGAITGTVGGGVQTYANVIVTITDASSVSVASSAFTWTVKAAPTVTPVNQTTTLGAVVSYTPPSTCPNTPCTFTMTGAPTGLSISNAGVITGTVGGATQTYANVIVTITDNAGVSVASSAFTWTVLAKPTVTAPATQTTTIGKTISGLTVASTCANTPCTYSMTGAPTGLTINNSAVISGTVGGPAQTYANVIVTITDNAGVSVASSAFSWIVKAAPTVTPVNQTTTLGAVVSYTPPSTCSNTPCTFTLTGAPTGLSINSTTGAITGTVGGGVQTYANVIVTITDVAGVSTASAPFSWTVKAAPTVTAPATQTTTIGKAVSLSVVSSCANTPCTYSMTGAPTGLSISNAGVITGTVGGAAQTYANVIVTITDVAGVSTVSTPFSWIVKAAPAIAPVNQTSTLGVTVNYTPLWSCANTPCTFTMTGAPAGLSINSTTGAITGTVGGAAQTYANVIVTITDVGGVSIASAPFTWTVLAKPTVTPPATQTTTVGKAVSLTLASTCPNTPCTYSMTGAPTGLSINNSAVISGTVGGTPQTYANVIVTITDNAGVSVASTAFSWIVKAAPTVSPVNQTTTLNAVVNYTPPSTCPNTPCTFTMTGAPTGLTINNTTGAITGTVGGAAQIYANVIVTITDASSVSVASSAFTWTVLAKPTVTAPATQTTTIGKAVSLTLVSTCSKTPCTFSMTGAPTGLSINNAGVISGTVGGSAQTYANVIVTITDNAGVSTPSTPFTWIVKAVPTVTPVNQTTTVGATVNLTIPFTCTNTPCTFTMTGAPTGLSISNAGVVTGTVGGAVQTYSNVIVTVTDASSVSVASTPFSWVVKAAPTVTSLGNQVVTVGLAVSVQLTTTCPNSPCTYTFNNGPGNISISATGLLTGTIAGPAQTYPAVTVSVKDAANVTVSTTSFSVQVNAAPTMGNPANQSVRGGSADSLNTATLVSGGTAPFTYSATGLPAWLSINASTGVISGTAPSAHSVTSGITVTVSDVYGINDTSAAFSWVVTFPSIAIPNQVSVRNTALSVDLDNYVTGGTAPYTLTLTGAALPAGLTYNTTTHVVSGTPTTVATTLTLTAKATDSLGAIATDTFTWQIIASTTMVWSTVPNRVSAPNTAITAFDVRTLVSNDKANYTAVGLPTGLSMAALTGIITGTPTVPGSYQVTVMATENIAGTLVIASKPFTWSVTTMTVGAIGNQSTARNAADSFDVSTVVSGGILPYTFSATGLPAWLTINASTGVISGTAPGTTSSTTGITVTVTDLTGAVVTSGAFTWGVT